MVKRIFLYCIVGGTIAFGAFFGVSHQAAAISPSPSLPNGTYCNASASDLGINNTSDPKDVLSFIEYGESYQALGSDTKVSNGQSRIDSILSDPNPRDSSGLVPCGRQCDDPSTAVNEAVPCNFCHIFVLFHNIVNTFLKWAALLVILLVAWGGFIIMVSGGSTGAGKTIDIAGVGALLTGGGVTGLRKGKALIYSALIGYAIMLSAWIIVNMFFSLIGVASWVGIGNWWQPNCQVPQTPGVSILLNIRNA